MLARRASEGVFAPPPGVHDTYYRGDGRTWRARGSHQQETVCRKWTISTFRCVGWEPAGLSLTGGGGRLLVNRSFQLIDTPHQASTPGRFSPATEVVQMCVHIQELLDIVNNQSTLEGFNLDDVKVMLRELCEN